MGEKAKGAVRGREPGTNTPGGRTGRAPNDDAFHSMGIIRTRTLFCCSDSARLRDRFPVFSSNKNYVRSVLVLAVDYWSLHKYATFKLPWS
jgi:hypothetical protein